MDRPTVARWREIASLLVAGSLLASTLAPALIVSASPLRPVAATLPTAQPSPGSMLTVAGREPGSGVALGVGPGSPVKKPSDPPRSTPTPTTRPAPACNPAPGTFRPAPVVRHGPRDEKVVALTFDDGWDAGNTLQILATLRHFRVNATFFPIGRAVRALPDVWQAVADAGYPIGDHSYDHPHMEGLCFGGQLSQLLRPQRTIREVLGIEPINLMRPPYGAYDWNTRLAANAAGDARVVLWDIDTRDWDGLTRTQITRLAVAGGNGSIVLMHTFPHATAAALPHIIWNYWERGYRFVTVGQLLGLGGPVPYP